MALLTPRPLPDRRLPLIAGGLVVAIALPAFLAADWPIAGWALGAGLWIAAQVLGFVLEKIGIGAPSLAGSGVVAFGMMTRGILLIIVAIVVASFDRNVGLAGALVYAAAYTVELALSLTDLLLRGAEAMTGILAGAGTLLASTEDFQPQDEFTLKPWIDIHLGGLDLSVNKAVVYLWVGGLLTIVIGLWIMRFGLRLMPNRKQTSGEALYELVQTQIAEGNLPSKAIGTWFPFVAALFLFIWIVNIVGFIPLPISNESFTTIVGIRIPTFAIYAATANLSVTLALALITFVATHYEGIRYNGPVKYFKSWIPSGVPGGLLFLIVPLEVISQFMRLISLSVRLFANMLAGHMLILVMLGLIFIFDSLAIAVIAVPVAVAVYIFEVAIVVTIQAFVFALLSAIYIGGAIEPEH